MTEPGSQSTQLAPPGESRRLHPLTPFAKGWAAVAVATVYLGQDALRELDPIRLLLTMAGVAVVGSAYGLLSWWFTRYVVEGDDLRVEVRSVSGKVTVRTA